MADFDQLKEWVNSSWAAQAEWREEAEDDYAFLAGHQWTESEAAAMKENSRIPIVFNRVATILASVAGSEINNRTEVRFIPREIGDAKPNEILTAGAEWFRDQADAEDADSEAFLDVLVSGIGATDTSLDFDEDPMGRPSVEKLDPLELGWDHHSRQKGLIDARYLFTVQSIPTSEAESRFEGKDASEISASWVKASGSEGEHTNVAGDQWQAENGETEDRTDTVTVVRIQYREREKLVDYIDPQTGQKDTMPHGQWDAITKRIPLALPHRTFSKWVWKQAFLGRDSIIDENQPDKNGPTINVITGHWDRKDRLFYGLLRSMKDPQKYANKWLSQTLHIINSNTKGGVMAEAGAVDDAQSFEESWAAADAVTWVNDGSIAAGRIQPKQGVQMPSALMSLTEFAISSIRDVSGVNMELLGLRDANQPGVLEYQRRQSAMTTLARFFDSLRHYRKKQGATILHFLRDHIAPTGRLVRVVKDDQAQYVPLAVADETEDYDVIVDDAPQAPNEKEKSWSVIQAMLPMLQNANLSLEDWADIMEYSPLPSSVSDKIRQKAVEQKQQGPDPMQQMAQQMAALEMQKAQVDITKSQSEIAENTAETQLDSLRAAQIAQETRLRPVEVMSNLPVPGMMP